MFDFRLNVEIREKYNFIMQELYNLLSNYLLGFAWVLYKVRNMGLAVKI